MNGKYRPHTMFLHDFQEYRVKYIHSSVKNWFILSSNVFLWFAVIFFVHFNFWINENFEIYFIVLHNTQQIKQPHAHFIVSQHVSTAEVYLCVPKKIYTQIPIHFQCSTHTIYDNFISIVWFVHIHIHITHTATPHARDMQQKQTASISSALTKLTERHSCFACVLFKTHTHTQTHLKAHLC